ncbi:hypothetical protein FRC18_009949 [Serendipita sp. 400]|nr:hypothetical protein FRC18_009949 [Serendipita sp. 400]
MEQLHETRESVRDTLSSIYPTIFPRTGACQAPMDALLSHLGLLNVVQYCVIHQCDNMRTVTRLGLRTIFLDDSARCLGGSPQPLTTVEDWFHAQLSTALDEESSCATCCQPLRSTQQYKVINAPPLLVVENSLARGISTKLVPGCSIELRSQDPEGRKTYTLRGVLYHGSAHYTARIFLPPAYPTQANPYVMWNYDGMTGAPSLEGTFDASSEQLLTCKQRSAIYFLYRLEAP